MSVSDAAEERKIASLCLFVLCKACPALCLVVPGDELCTVCTLLIFSAHYAVRNGGVHTGPRGRNECVQGKNVPPDLHLVGGLVTCTCNM